MTQEDKELLMKDLCARLPYGVMVNAQYKDGEGWKTEDRKILGLYENGQVYLDCVYTTIDCIKPYLRPMPSMTEKEIKELSKIDQKRIIFSARHLTWHLDGEVIDYLNEKMFDWRGLIPKGLALEAPKGMYKNK